MKRQPDFHIILKRPFEILRRGGTDYLMAGGAELGAEFHDLDLGVASGHDCYLIADSEVYDIVRWPLWVISGPSQQY